MFGIFGARSFDCSLANLLPDHDFSSTKVIQPSAAPSISKMKPFAVLLFLVLAIVATIAPEVRGLQVAQQGAHLRHLQDQPDDQGQPNEQPEQPNEQPEQPDDQQQPGMPIPMNQPGADQGGAGNNEILVGGCFPGSWNWPRCRFGGGGGCFPGSWNWPRCRYGGGGCFPGSWNWPRCRYW